jgi:hypothetical protein
MGSIKRGSGLDYFLDSPLYGGTGQSRNPGAQRERRIQQMLERNIAELALNRFKYENLPDSVDARFLEKVLLFNGVAVWYWDNDYDKLLAVSGAGMGAYNFYENPLSFTTIGPGNQIILDGVAGDTFKPKQLSAYIPASDKDLPDDERKQKAVGMYPNALRIPDIDIVMIYSSRLATTDRSLEINAKNARRNKVVTSTPNTQLSMRNIARQQDMGVEVIEVSGAARPEDNIIALDLGIDSSALTELSVLRSRWWNECMGLLGIDNANQDKKERLVESEVGANDAQTDSMRYVALNARRQALEYINDIFNQNITVDYNVEVEAQAKAMAEAQGMEPDAATDEKPEPKDKAEK